MFQEKTKLNYFLEISDKNYIPFIMLPGFEMKPCYMTRKNGTY